MKKECELVRDHLVDLEAGRVAGQDLTGIREHLLRCPDCSEEQAVVRALRRGGLTPAPPALEADILSALDAVGAGRPSPEGSGAISRGSWLGGRRLALAAAVAAVAIAGGVLLRGGGAPGRGGTPAPVASEETPSTEIAPWPGKDGEIAGVATLGDLSVDELQTLLEEMES